MTHIVALIVFTFAFISLNAFAGIDSTKTTKTPLVVVGLSGVQVGEFGFAPSIFAGVGFNLVTTKKVKIERTMEGKKVKFVRTETPIVWVKNFTKMQVGVSTGLLFMVSIINETPIRMFGMVKGKACLQFVPFLQVGKAAYFGSQDNYSTTPISILVGSGLNLETKRLNVGFSVSFNSLTVKQTGFTSNNHGYTNVYGKANYSLQNRLIGFNLSYRLN